MFIEDEAHSLLDVFFVISDYLMTAIIFNKLRDHRFSLIEFYLHRAVQLEIVSSNSLNP